MKDIFSCNKCYLIVPTYRNNNKKGIKLKFKIKRKYLPGAYKVIQAAQVIIFMLSSYFHVIYISMLLHLYIWVSNLAILLLQYKINYSLDILCDCLAGINWVY